MNKCLICKEPITEPRYRKFCSQKCRQKYNNLKNRQYQILWAKNKRGLYSPEKLKCEICNKYYKFLDPHLRQQHGVSVNKYKENLGLNRKKGLISDQIKLLKKDYVFTNGTIDNLKKGIKTRYKKNDSRAGKYERRKETLDQLKNRLARYHKTKSKICQKKCIDKDETKVGESNSIKKISI